MIAVTETTRVFAEGNKLAWDSTGVVSGSKWQTANDDLVCPICGPLNEQVTDDEPPAHVNCRCWKRPVVDEELVKQKFAEIFA
jgi:rubredoxin